MTTYNVDATIFKGSLLRFKPHSYKELPSFHHTLNTAYVLSLFESNINFVFEDVGITGLTKILKEAPKLLHIHMIDHIKYKSGATTRGQEDKVDDLFGKMTLYFRLKSGKDYEFDLAQELTKGIDLNLKRQCDGVPENIYARFFFLFLYLSVPSWYGRRN